MEAKSGSRKRSQKQKKRVSEMNAYRFQDKRVEETRAELDFMKKDLGRRAHFQAISQQLLSTLVFRQVPKDEADPFKKLSREKGQKISKKLSFFLRHDLPVGTYSKTDGTLDIAFIQSSLRLSREEILLATHPAYGHKGDDKVMKRRFIVLEKIHPDKSRETRVAALGDHSIEVEAPPGHFPLGKESLTQLAPLTHRTSATKDILNAGFLCQQSRRGGINLCTGKNSYKEGASHEIEIIADAAHQDGHEFFGNRFSDVVFAMGKWTHGHWDGKVGLKFLKIKPLR